MTKARVLLVVGMALIPGLLAAPAPLAGAAQDNAPSPGAPPHIDHVIKAIQEAGSAGGVDLQGKAWQLTTGNALKDPAEGDWLLQTPDCWGQDQCKPAAGETHFLDALEHDVSGAQTLVDITGLLPYPDGEFEKSLARGIAAAYRDGKNPLIRVLYGVSPGSDPSGSAPQRFLDSLTKEITDDMGDKPSPQPRIAVGDFKSSASLTSMSWNHSKIVAVDGKEAIVGGVNFYDADYLQSDNPVTDTSMQVSGPAALAASRFADQLWGFSCQHIGFVYASWAHSDAVSDCPSSEADLVAAAAKDTPGDTTILALGRMGEGIVSSTSKDNTPSDVSQDDLSQADCWKSLDYTNNSTNYDSINPGEVGLRALVSSARQSIFLSQQDLLQSSSYCPPMAKFDVRLFKTLAEKIAAGVSVTIVVSNPGAKVGRSAYSNDQPVLEIAKDLFPYVSKDAGSDAKASELICKNLQLAPLRTSDADGWPGVKGDQSLPSLHTKVVMVDKEAFYIGSENLYPAYLQEFGYVVENAQAAKALDEKLLAPEWKYSSRAAVVGDKTCPFPVK